LRIVLVTNDYPPRPGGIQQYLGNLISHLDAEVMVVAPADERAATEANIARFHRRFMWPTRDVRAFVRSTAAAFAADVVLFGAPHPLPAMGPWLRASLGIPFGVLTHGAEVTMPSAFPVVRQLLARHLSAADVRFAVSRFTAGRVEALTGRPVTYVGAGVDVDTFSPAPQSPDNDPPIVGCVSRFVPRKGQGVLIEAMARLGRPAELLLVGAGRTEVALRRLAADRGVDARFAVDVAWESLPGLYREMDVFCMPCRSRWGGLEPEGLGLVFLEAAATGLPVLVGDSGGAPETVLPGESGFIVHGPDDIAEALELLLDSPQRRSAMGGVGRERVVNEFTWPKVAHRFIRGFEDIL
jgi:phosphatidylinositol alpha-1,6-mannosyltransferase